MLAEESYLALQLRDKLGRKMHGSMRVYRDQFERCPDCL